MSDQARKAGVLPPDDDLDITGSLQNLSNPPDFAQDEDTGEFRQASALLVCRDSTSQKWGPRWLKQSGLNPSLISKPGEALAAARLEKPSVIIVEGGLRDSVGTPLYQALQDAVGSDVPVIALCANSKEVQAALDVGVFDVVRKPVEWQLISRRAMQAARASGTESRLSKAKDSLTKALDLADSARQHLRSRELFDPVTGLPNKTKFIDLLKRGMKASKRDRNHLAVFVIGFNRFRLVIEAMGQETANLVLAEVGKRLTECLYDAGSAQVHTTGLRTAAAASLDVMRFGLMLTCSAESDELAVLQQQLTENLSRPVLVSSQTVYLSACVGIALYPQDADDVDSLLQRAENAMRDAQSRGGGFRFYCQETDAAAARKLRIEHMLHEAFNQDELSVAYQPLWDVANDTLVGCEALLRWRQTDDSYVPPDVFVPIAEESGLMIPIGRFVLDQACGQLKTWHREGMSSFRVSVNVSKCQLMSSGFAETVDECIRKHGIDPDCLDLELSERGVLSGDQDVISELHELKRLGVRLSLDDFGTGESAIAYLKDLPIDVIKIDRSFVKGLTKKGKDAAITSAMVALAQRLDLTVVAEGVETLDQLAILQELGCDEYQGFYKSPAIPGNRFAGLLKKSNHD
jgi:predicted signal transduction protein with EAL and GGDEF domain